MNNKYTFALLLALLALSCGEAEEPATTASSERMLGASGQISFSVTPDETPHAGENFFRVCLALPDGEALTEASISLQTWMPSMSHGGPAVPSPSDLGAGCYRAAVVFAMPGFWELHIQARDASREDGATISYDIP